MADDSRVKQFSEAQLSVEENYLLDWILEVLKIPENERPDRTTNDSSQLYDTLANGILLCRLINQIAPGSIRRIHPATRPLFAQMENIGFFITAVEKLGVHQSQLFDAPDLRDSARRNRTKVVATLKALALIANDKGITPQFNNDETILSIGRIIDDSSISNAPSKSAAAATTTTTAPAPSTNIKSHASAATATATAPISSPRFRQQPVHHYIPPSQPKQSAPKHVVTHTSHHYTPPKPVAASSAVPTSSLSRTTSAVISSSALREESGLDELVLLAAKMEQVGVDDEGRIKTPRQAPAAPVEPEPEDNDIVPPSFPVFDRPLITTNPIDDFLAAVKLFKQELQA